MGAVECPAQSCVLQRELQTCQQSQVHRKVKGWLLQPPHLHSGCAPISEEVCRNGARPHNTPHIIALIDGFPHYLAAKRPGTAKNQYAGLLHWGALKGCPIVGTLRLLLLLGCFRASCIQAGMPPMCASCISRLKAMSA